MINGEVHEPVEEVPVNETPVEPTPAPAPPAVVSEDPDVLTLVIQLNNKTKQSRVIWPKGVGETYILYGMLEMAKEVLIRGQMIRDVTQSVMRSIREQMAIKGRGGLKLPTPQDIIATKQ